MLELRPLQKLLSQCQQGKDNTLDTLDVLQCIVHTRHDAQHLLRDVLVERL